MPTHRLFLAVFLAALLPLPALAGPLDDAHVGETGFSGPTTGDLTAVYWNPAALGLLQGVQVMAGGTLQSTSVSVARTSIDPATGTNPGTTTFQAASGSSIQQPIRWPPGQGGFLGLGAGIGRRFAIALALYSPFSSRLTMNGQEPTTRYHLVSMDFEHVAVSVGLAIHISDSIQIGVAPGAIFPFVHMVFDEPSTGLSGSAEDPASAARFDMASRGLLIPSFFGSVGLHYRHRSVDVGLAYTAYSLANGGAITVPLDNTQITMLDSFETRQSLCPTGSSTPCFASQMTYRLPDIGTAGVTWQATKAWSATGIVRWIRNSENDKITILVSGPATQPLLGSVVPDHVVFYRGFVDSFDLRGRVVYATNAFRVGATLRLETSAVPASHVNAAAIDGTKLEPSVAVEVRLGRRLRLSVGYAFLWMLPVSTGNSVFDPTSASSCTQAGGDLNNPACQARANGMARPSAAGDYRMWRQTFSAMTTFGF